MTLYHLHKLYTMKQKINDKWAGKNVGLQKPWKSSVKITKSWCSVGFTGVDQEGNILLNCTDLFTL